MLDFFSPPNFCALLFFPLGRRLLFSPSIRVTVVNGYSFVSRPQVHSKFVNPTRERLKGLLHGTMSLTAALYMILALCGYLYAYDNTKVK